MPSDRSQASLVVELVRETADLELFHTGEFEPFVRVHLGAHAEVWPLRSGSFRRWVARLFYERYGKTAGGQALADGLGVLEGEALFGGVQHDVHLRIAGDDNAIFVDLVDEFWQQIMITADGWDIIPAADVLFRRSRGMRPLPYPVAGGTVDELRDFVNVTDDEWPLLAGWAIAAFRSRGPYPVLQVHGEQGSAKSTGARVLRELVDPNAAPLRSEPREARDLMVAAHNGWIVAFDNVSHLSPWLSDAICRLSTGGGFSTRELYSDKDEVLIDVMRPVIVNGIEELGTRGDLLDRSLLLDLPRIGSFRPEADFWAAFEEAQPRILGALLDAVAGALRKLPTVRLTRNPRMADFGLWATAAEEIIGLAPGTFMRAYDGNRAAAHELSLEASPITAPLREVADDGFSGTATELLDRLTSIASEEAVRAKNWPKNASALGGALRRLAPNLRATGIEIDFDNRTGSRRIIDVRTAPQNAVIPVTPVTADDGDDGNDGVLPSRSTQGRLA